MLVYVVCAEVPYDSYHQVVLATLNIQEAKKAISEQNAKHDPDCRTQRATESDWDECFCKQYHMHSVSLLGWAEKLKALLRFKAFRDYLLREMSALSDSMPI